MPSTPGSVSAGKPGETVGLFKGATEHQHTSSFASLRDSIPAGSVSEFGQSQSPSRPHAQTLSTLPSHPSESARASGEKHGLASRFFSFGRRGSTKDVKDTPIGHRSVSAPKPGSISSPIASSLQRLDDKPRRPSDSSVHVVSPIAAGILAGETLGQGVSPQSPASPRSVRRKPVPGFEGVNGDGVGGMTGSESLSSMRSFVLEDPPKRRPKNLA